MLCRRIGAALGVSWQIVLKDFSASTYSSARTDLLEARQTYVYFQKWFIEKYLDWQWFAVMEDARLNGELPGITPEEIEMVTWIPNGWRWVDPEKEAKGVQIELEIGITSLRDVCASQGKDWEEVMRQRLVEEKREKELRKEMGLEEKKEKPDDVPSDGRKVEAGETEDGEDNQPPGGNGNGRRSVNSVERKDMPQDRSLTDLTCRAFEVVPSSWDEETRSFDAILATETPTVVMDMRRRRPIEEVLIMEGAILPQSRQIPLLDTHQRKTTRNVLGSVRDIKVDGNKLVGRVFVSSVEDRVATKIREGHITDNSLGYLPTEGEFIEPGQTREVNGITYTARELPLQVSLQWKVKENSVLPIGADELAKIREEVMPSDLRQESLPEEKPKEEPKEEVKEEPKKEEVKETADPSRRELLEDITPRGFEDFLTQAVVDGLDVDSYRNLLKVEVAKRMEPVGTPEPPEDKKKEDGLENVTDEDFLRAF
jgi:hypothetical protein